MSHYRIYIDEDENDQLGALTAQVYTVKKGDTLNSIASQYDTTAIVLASSNNMSEFDPIYIGQKIFIPGGAGVALPTNLNDLLNPTPTNSKNSNSGNNSNSETFSDWLKKNQNIVIGAVGLLAVLLVAKKN